MTPVGCWTGSAAPARRSSAAATPTRPPVAAFGRPATSSRPWPCWRSTAGYAASTPTPPGPRAAGHPRRGSWSTPCTPPQNPHNPQNLARRLVLWVLWVLWRVATPREAADADQGGLSRYPTRTPPAALGRPDHPPPPGCAAHDPAGGRPAAGS